MLRAARRNAPSTSGPAMTSAFVTPNLPNCARSAAVLASFSATASSTIRAPSFTFDDSACLSASARTFFGRAMAWLRTTGPNARLPPTNCAARREPCRAPPVPFCRYIFLPVRLFSLRVCTLWVPARRLASCQFTQRARMSGRISSMPKIASGSSIWPALPPARVTTSCFILRFVPGGLGRRRLRLGGGLGLGRRGRGALDRAWRRQVFRRSALHRVADADVAAVGARNSPPQNDKTALRIDAKHGQVQGGDGLLAKVAGHLLALEGSARILAIAGRTQRAVGYRDPVRRAQAAEVPALDAALEALADRDARHVDRLAGDEMVGRDLGAHRQEVLLRDAELGEAALRLDQRLGEVTAHGLRHVLDLRRPGAELDRGVAVLVLRALGGDLAAVEREHRDGDVTARLVEEAGHAQLFGDNAGAHDPALLELDLDVHAGREGELHERVHGLRGRVDDVEHAFVRADFELLARLLVDVRRAVDGELLDERRQRDRPAHRRAGALGRIDDLARRMVQHPVVEGFEPDAYVLSIHLARVP